MPINNKICLGSAQFGLNYGITNTKGKLSMEDVRDIIDFAVSKGIDTIDTAQNYGDSEKIIGKYISNKSNIKIISKLKSHNKNNFTTTDISNFQRNLEDSLKNLKVTHLDCLLIHDEKDLFKEGSELLLEWINKIKLSGLIKNFGVSIYNFKNIHEIKKFNFDNIQLPLSIYDRQNFESGFIKRLTEIDIRIQVRSIYLQGIILSMTNQLPKWINNKDFAEHDLFHKKLKELNIKPIQAAIEYVKSIKEIESIVIGVTSKQELEELIDILDKDFDFDLFQKIYLPKFTQNLLDPRNWPL